MERKIDVSYCKTKHESKTQRGQRQLIMKEGRNVKVNDVEALFPEKFKRNKAHMDHTRLRKPARCGPVQRFHSLSSSWDDIGSSPGKSMTRPPHGWTLQRTPIFGGPQGGCRQEWRCLDDADIVVDGVQRFSNGVGNLGPQSQSDH
uniref:Uncharacterized protein n=1 Tax=Romanomermis culicivorax TaxID=13658 RepID=A0A915KUN3_ROMCU